MPWMEMSIMEQRQEFVALAMQEGANRRELCRRFGISPTTGYRMISRARNEGAGALADRSRRPKTSPGRTCATVERAVLAVRDAHPVWGARKIRHCLIRDGLAPPAASTVHAILSRHGRIATDEGGSASHTSRFEKDAPNLLWQMDFKGHVPLERSGQLHPLTVIDDHSRYALCLAACANQRSSTVMDKLTGAFRRYGLPDAIYVDNGSPWGGARDGRRGTVWTPLRVWLLKHGVRLIYSRPYHPQGRGKNERFHRTLKAEVMALRRFASLEAAQGAFDAWRHVYNMERPHEALDGDVPLSRYTPSARAMPEALPEVTYDDGEITRSLRRSCGRIRFEGRMYAMPRAFGGERIAVRPTAKDGIYDLYFAAYKVGQIDTTKNEGVHHVPEQV